MAKTTSSRTWLVTLALVGALALSGCGAGNGSASGDDAPVATQDSTAQGEEQQSGSDATPEADNSEELYELTRTYTDPAKLFTLKYPQSWTAKEDRGYLELTSPDGKVHGRVSSTKVRPPQGDWFTRPTHPLIGDETALSDQVGVQVFTYSTYVPTPSRNEHSDSVLWGLTESDGQGIVPLPGGDKKDRLWAEFYYSPVNEGNRPLSQSQGVALVHKINDTDEAGAVDAILKSVRVTG